MIQSTTFITNIKTQINGIFWGISGYAHIVEFSYSQKL